MFHSLVPISMLWLIQFVTNAYSRRHKIHKMVVKWVLVFCVIVHGLDIVVMWKQYLTHTFLVCVFSPPSFWMLSSPWLVCSVLISSLTCSRVSTIWKGPIIGEFQKNSIWNWWKGSYGKWFHTEQKKGSYSRQRWRLETAEPWCYRRMLRIRWTEK